MSEQNKTYKIKDLIEESTKAGSSSNRGPALQALTRASRSLIYEDLVAVQETEQPIAALYGVRLLNSNGDMNFLSHATYSGMVNSRLSIADAQAKAYVKDELFKKGDIVYKVIKPFTLASDDYDAINRNLIIKNIRYMSDAAETSDLEYADVAEVCLQIDRWDSQVRSRKLKTEFSLELMQDMEANQLLGKNIPFDLLVTIISEDTNKDICQKLLHVSKVHDGAGVVDGVLAIGGMPDPDLSRTVYRTIVDMGESVRKDSSFKPTYVLASTKIVTLLKSSGWVKDSKRPLSEGVTRCGLEIYADDTSPMEYAVVGFKHRLGDLEYVSSLFYSPYSSTYSVVKNTESFNNNLMILNRYALSVNPWSLDYDFTDKAMVINGDDWDMLGGKSVNSRSVMFDFDSITLLMRSGSGINFKEIGMTP